jgi:hypothetical protein
MIGQRWETTRAATMAAYSMWAVTSLLSSVYDYAGACNAINPVMHEGPRVQIAIAPSLPIGEGYQSFVWIIHIRDIPKLWDDNGISQKPVVFMW